MIFLTWIMDFLNINFNPITIAPFIAVTFTVLRFLTNRSKEENLISVIDCKDGKYKMEFDQKNLKFVL